MISIWPLASINGTQPTCYSASNGASGSSNDFGKSASSSNVRDRCQQPLQLSINVVGSEVGRPAYRHPRQLHSATRRSPWTRTGVPSDTRTTLQNFAVRTAHNLFLEISAGRQSAPEAQSEQHRVGPSYKLRLTCAAPNGVIHSNIELNGPARTDRMLIIFQQNLSAAE